MICPNCDHILNIRGCTSCGWQHGDPHPKHRGRLGSAHPYKPGGEYPVEGALPIAPGVKITLQDEPVSKEPAPVEETTPEPVAAAEPEPVDLSSISTPSTVQ